MWPGQSQRKTTLASPPTVHGRTAHPLTASQQVLRIRAWPLFPANSSASQVRQARRRTRPCNGNRFPATPRCSSLANVFAAISFASQRSVPSTLVGVCLPLHLCTSHRLLSIQQGHGLRHVMSVRPSRRYMHSYVGALVHVSSTNKQNSHIRMFLLSLSLLLYIGQCHWWPFCSPSPAAASSPWAPAYSLASTSIVEHGTATPSLERRRQRDWESQ